MSVGSETAHAPFLVDFVLSPEGRGRAARGRPGGLRDIPCKSRCPLSPCPAVLYACQKLEQEKKQDADLAAAVQQLCARLKSCGER